MKLHLSCTASCPVVFRFSPGNSRNAPEGRKFIESTYPKNRDFFTVVPPKKNRKYHWLYDKKLYKQRNITARYFLRLKRFKKVFSRYDKFDSIFISTISLAFIFDSLFM